MIRHLLTTASEVKVEACLEQCAEKRLRAFVHIGRFEDDPLHVRYNVYAFVPNKCED